MASPQDQRQAAVRDAGSNLRLTAEVLEYMEAIGDTTLVFAATVLTLQIPRSLHAARTQLGTSMAELSQSETDAQLASHRHHTLRKSSIVSCNLLARDQEAVLAVGTRSVYVLPAERIPIDDILEFVVHAHCSSPFPCLEIRVGNPDGSNDVRFVALSSDYMLRQAVAVVQTACPFARLVFHSHGWIARKKSKGASSDGSDDDAVLPASLRRSRLQNVASDTAQKRLAAYRKQRVHSDAAVSRVTSFGPGRYSEAADALSHDLGRMMSEVDRMLEVTGPPEPLLSTGKLHGGTSDAAPRAEAAAPPPSERSSRVSFASVGSPRAGTPAQPSRDSSRAATPTTRPRRSAMIRSKARATPQEL